MLQHFIFVSVYTNTALNDFGVIYVHPASSEPDMLLLLLKALINISAPFSPTRLTSWALSSSTDFSLTISCLSTGLNPALSKRSRVAPRRTLSLSAFSARSVGKLFQTCKAVVEELFQVDKVNELHREVTLLRELDVPEVLEVQVVPSVEVRMVPDWPTVTKVLFP